MTGPNVPLLVPQHTISSPALSFGVASALACCDQGGTQMIWRDRLAQHPLISASTHEHRRIAAHDHIWNALLLKHTLERTAVVVAQDVVDNSSIDTALITQSMACATVRAVVTAWAPAEDNVAEYSIAAVGSSSATSNLFPRRGRICCPMANVHVLWNSTLWSCCLMHRNAWARSVVPACQSAATSREARKRRPRRVEGRGARRVSNAIRASSDGSRQNGGSFGVRN